MCKSISIEIDGGGTKTKVLVKESLKVKHYLKKPFQHQIIIMLALVEWKKFIVKYFVHCR